MITTTTLLQEVGRIASERGLEQFEIHTDEGFVDGNITVWIRTRDGRRAETSLPTEAIVEQAWEPILEAITKLVDELVTPPADAAV